MVKSLIFHCLMSLWPDRCLLGTYNAFFMDLPVLSFVFHSSLPAEKCWFGGCMWWLPLRRRKISVFFILVTLIMQLLFKYVTGWTQLSTKCNGYFVFQMIINILGHVMPYMWFAFCLLWNHFVSVQWNGNVNFLSAIVLASYPIHKMVLIRHSEFSLKNTLRIPG